MPNGDHLWRMSDHARTRREIYRHSPTDAEAYDEYAQGDGRDGALREADPVDGAARPVRLRRAGLRHASPGWASASATLSRGQQHSLLQLMTMSAADLLDQWFETDVLKATMSASGIIGTFLGVRSPGTAYVLLHHYMGEIDGAFRSWGFSRGRHRRHQPWRSPARRARPGVEIRTEAPVARIKVEGRPRHRRRARRTATRSTRRVVLSSVDPRIDLPEAAASRATCPREFLDGRAAATSSAARRAR